MAIIRPCRQAIVPCMQGVLTEGTPGPLWPGSKPCCCSCPGSCPWSPCRRSQPCTQHSTAQHIAADHITSHGV